MAERSVVAVKRTKPETVLQDVTEVMKLARFRNQLDPAVTVILKDNISWHFPFLSANTTPWQLQGVIMALKDAGFRTPLVYLFVFGSFFYHDYIYWPFKAKPQIDAFKKTSKWGQLFDSYPE